jgi:hypothetical protein
MSFLKGIGWLCHGTPLDTQPACHGFDCEPAHKNNKESVLFAEKEASKGNNGYARVFQILPFLR